MKQKRFDGITEISDASESQIALVFLLDTSGSMSGAPIKALSDGLNRFKTEVCKNQQTREILDVAIVEFNSDFHVVEEFIAVEYMEPVNLVARNGTQMTPAIRKALKMIKERSKLYRNLGSEPYTPWIVLISSGTPSDDITAVAEEIKSMENNGEVNFYSLGIGEYDSKILHTLSGEKVIKLLGTDFNDFFYWLNKSMHSVAKSLPGEKIKTTELAGNIIFDTQFKK